MNDKDIQIGKLYLVRHGGRDRLYVCMVVERRKAFSTLTYFNVFLGSEKFSVFPNWFIKEATSDDTEKL